MQSSPTPQRACRRSPAGQSDITDISKADVEDASNSHAYVCTPPPPLRLWDTDDVQFLDKVTCDVTVRLTRIDPKCGAYEARMRIEWALRTLNSQERTEPRLRIPSIRIPLLAVSVEESRVWRIDEAGTRTTHYWNGLTILNVSGFEVFEVHDFPFDRQVIDMDLFDFVWKSEKDVADYDVAMKVVKFTMRTTSMLPDWDTFPAVVTPLNSSRQGTGPSNASRFRVQLRLQRKQQYFIQQVFALSYLITCASILPLALPPDAAADRLALHGGGLLTLIAFKYAVSEQLPSVPYITRTDKYLMVQVIILVLLSVESVISFKIDDWGLLPLEELETLEMRCLFVILGLWTLYFIYASFCIGRRSWEEVLASQEGDVEMQDAGHIPLRASRSSSRALFRE